MDKELTENGTRTQVQSLFRPRLQEQNEHQQDCPSLKRSYNVNEAQEEILTLSFLVSQLMLRSTWVGTQGHNNILSTALLTIMRMMGGLLVPIVPAIQSKMRINARKYPSSECKKSSAIEHYTKHSGKTGIQKDSDVPLFQDINNIQYVPKHCWFLNGGPSKIQETVNEDQLYYGNLRDFDDNFDLLSAQVETFATQRNWIDKYTETSIYMSLLSEIGELSSVIQWSQPQVTLMTLSIQTRDQLARELCDITIYLLHFCRLKKTRVRLHHNLKQNNLHRSWGKYVFPSSYNIHNQDTLVLQHEAYGPNNELSLEKTQPQDLLSTVNLLEIRGMDDIVYKILYMLTGDGFHVYSDVHPNKKHRNPTERQRLYNLSILGFKALTNLMIASRRVRTLVNDTRKLPNNNPTVYNPYPYNLVRERLIVEKAWQSWYTLQNLKSIEKPYNTDEDNITDPGAEEPPQWLVERWVYLTLQQRCIVERPCPVTGLRTDPLTRPELYYELNPEARSFDSMELEVHQTPGSYLRTHTLPNIHELVIEREQQPSNQALHQQKHPDPDPEGERQLYYSETDHQQIEAMDIDIDNLEQHEHWQQLTNAAQTRQGNNYSLIPNQETRPDNNIKDKKGAKTEVPQDSLGWDSESSDNDQQHNNNNETSTAYPQLDIRKAGPRN
jgi:hypothetical protein